MPLYFIRQTDGVIHLRKIAEVARTRKTASGTKEYLVSESRVRKQINEHGPINATSAAHAYRIAQRIFESPKCPEPDSNSQPPKSLNSPWKAFAQPSALTRVTQTGPERIGNITTKPKGK